MLDDHNECPQLYRVWIARYEDWQPRGWDEVPPRYCAVELAVPECLPREAAACVLEGFNTAMLDEQRPGDKEKQFWAVAVAVELRYDGDPTPGAPISG
jgi:hypothetical protein